MPPPSESAPESTVDIDELFEPGNEEALRTYIRLLHPADIAALFDLVAQKNWPLLTRELSAESLAEVLTNLHDDQIEGLGKRLQTERLIEVVEELETDDAADVLADLPEEKSAAVLDELEDKEEIEALLAYPADSAGGIMQTEVCRVQSGSDVAAAIEAVRLATEDIDNIIELYVVDPLGRLQGSVALADLVLASESTPVEQIAQPIEHQVTAALDQEEVARVFRKYDLAALPVVDNEGLLLGRITFDDVHDVLEEEATEDVMAMAGASGDELVYSGAPLQVAFLRLPWLISSLLGSLITTQLVPLFSHVPGDTLVLAAFVPVVMAMTGNVGAQSAMIVTRGIAIGRVDLTHLGRSVLREMSVGGIMGITAGLVVGIFAHFSEGDSILGAALGLSMVCSMVVATGVGVIAPALFKWWGVDPAIAVGPLVTTGCDVLGVSIYLLIALLVLS